MSVLLVCAGNTCRSPMAAALLKSRQNKLTVGSAGLTASDRAPANVNTDPVMKNRGLSLAAHKACRLTDQVAATYDVVLVMEQGQVAEVRARCPSLPLTAVESLGDRAGMPGDVEDPIGSGPAAYEECALHLERLFKAIADRAPL